jgi:predicted alpha/beta superfamily hydrolase
MPSRDTPALDRLGEFVSRHVAARRVDVWLPPGYAADPGRRYPVLYMHDGQNLFDPATAFAGVDWGVDEAMARLAAAGEIRPAIVVGVWNTERRLAEYLPSRPFGTAPDRALLAAVPLGEGTEPESDAYLRFLTGELKPAIDRRYRTRPGRADTFIAGSSMGGLVSIYAVLEYPEVFGGAACLSTHWLAGEGLVADDVAARLPAPGRHRIYFDRGTEGLDAEYAPFQARVDGALRAAGYAEGRDWVSCVFEGAGHDEAAWRSRAKVPLRFLLG